MPYIAHTHQDGTSSPQLLLTHLTEVAALTSQFASKMKLAKAGELIGLLHDFGKYSDAFQQYIQTQPATPTRPVNPDRDDTGDSLGGESLGGDSLAVGSFDVENTAVAEGRQSHPLKGKIDHSTAGAQLIYCTLSEYGTTGVGRLCGQVLALCVAAHHSGLLNMLTTGEADRACFAGRMAKADAACHLANCQHNSRDEMAALLAEHLPEKGRGQPPAALSELHQVICQLRQRASKQDRQRLVQFNLGMLTRFLFSCLIDGDRINSAEFESPEQRQHRLAQASRPPWQSAIHCLERHLQQFSASSPIDQMRQQISQQCQRSAAHPRGIYRLSAPTGGGKTLASLRYALAHAKKHQLDHIFYFMPFTTIIEQNADQIRQILATSSVDICWVLEDHSQLAPDVVSWQQKISSANWQAPIVFSTLVQFLEALAGGGTRSVRRLHQFANSVLVFDEIQALPITCTHLFCNAVNFLVDHAGSSVLLCTATQPTLDQQRWQPHANIAAAAPSPVTEKAAVNIAANGTADISTESTADRRQPSQWNVLNTDGEILADVHALTEALKRVQIHPPLATGPKTCQQITDFALQQLQAKGSCLLIVNTKRWASDLYQACREQVSDSDALFHLSTHQCPLHRRQLFATIRQRLAQQQPVLCISTQLIEAGVDVDFATVIRFLAGLDAIAQAAGRCNRHGKQSCGDVWLIEPDAESLQHLQEIDIGKQISKRILAEQPQADLLSPAILKRYFEYFLGDSHIKGKMDYPCKSSPDSPKADSNLMRLLSTNERHPYAQVCRAGHFPALQQSFAQAGRAFQVIDAPTRSVVVPYVWPSEASARQLPAQTAQQVINTLCQGYQQAGAKEYRTALALGQQFYSVNLYPHQFEALKQQGALIAFPADKEMYYLDAQYYCPALGLCSQVVAEQELLCV